MPLRALLSALPPGTADTLEARATEGFVSEGGGSVLGSAGRRGGRHTGITGADHTF